MDGGMDGWMQAWMDKVWLKRVKVWQVDEKPWIYLWKKLITNVISPATKPRGSQYNVTNEGINEGKKI